MSRFNVRKVTIAKGYGAFGDAGRIGTWDDFLLVVTGATVLRVKPLKVKPGRGDAYLLLINEEFEVNKITYAEAELLEIQLHNSGTGVKGDFVRL